MKFTGERVVGRNIEEVIACSPTEGKNHVDRYQWAAARLRCGHVLDCASGCGFGSRILADELGTSSVLGVDISEEAVKYSSKHYAGGAVRFQKGDMLDLKLNRKFDTIVSLESVEHVPDPAIVLKSFMAMLNTDGRLIVSVPIVPSLNINQYHKWEVANEAAATAYFESLGLKIHDRFNQGHIYCTYLMTIGL